MTTLLLDASVLLSAFDTEDQFHAPSKKLLNNSTITLATLDLARYEVANVAIRAWQAPNLVRPLLAVIEQLSADGGVVTSTQQLLLDAAEIAQTHTLSIYDATYVAATGGANRELISCDTRDLVSKGLANHPK